MQNRNGLRENKLKVTKGMEGINKEFGIKICTLLYIKQVNNQDLLYSTENYSQHLVKTYNGKEPEKEYMYVCVCVTASLCWTPETNITL